jgi:hypothetical protein
VAGEREKPVGGRARAVASSSPPRPIIPLPRLARCRQTGPGESRTSRVADMMLTPRMTRMSSRTAKYVRSLDSLISAVIPRSSLHWALRPSRSGRFIYTTPPLLNGANHFVLTSRARNATRHRDYEQRSQRGAKSPPSNLLTIKIAFSSAPLSFIRTLRIFIAYILCLPRLYRPMTLFNLTFLCAYLLTNQHNALEHTFDDFNYYALIDFPLYR